MPNTDRYQVLPDYFPSKEIGKETERVNTNPRYKFFKQTQFTAGDYEQFLEFWDKTSHVRSGVKGYFHTPTQARCPLYRDIDVDAVAHTFEYMFHKFKKGIFVKIIDNELRVFLPFSKIDYINEWSRNVVVDTNKHKDLFDLIHKSTLQSGFSYDPSKTHFMVDHWYANNGLLRYEFPISENDSGIPTLRDMMLTLCKERKLPDCEFFINKRDFPILRQDRCEPYECVFGGKKPLVSHKHDTYCPILGMTTTVEHADIPMPTWDDWARVSFSEGKMFGKDFVCYPDAWVGDFSKKKATAVFRGASTGLGTTPSTNPRLYFCLLSTEKRTDVDGVPFLDCGMTKWNCRPRRSENMRFYDTFDPHWQQVIPLADFLSPEEQAGYKYILHLPGHSEAYRLSVELSMGSVVLLYPCKYKLWYSDLLVPYEHYVPIDPHKPDDVFDKIRWCKSHEKECEQIVKNARHFYETILSKEGLLDYMETMLQEVHETTGKLEFVRHDMFEFQSETQRNLLQTHVDIQRDRELFPFSVATPDKIDLSHVHPRTFQVFLHKLDHEFILDKIRNANVIKQSRNMTLRKIMVAHRMLCVKTPTRSDTMHENFVGQLVMNRIANVCPMIVYTYGIWGEHIITEYVEGMTLEDAISKHSTEKVPDFFIMILEQLSLLLNYLQSEFGFIHYDLYPWNIMVVRNKSGQTFSFPSKERSVSFSPEYYPVLIDFGKSHVVYKNMHFAKTTPFYLHCHQDMISIMVSGMHLIIQNHKLPVKSISKIVQVMNYVSGSAYTQYKTFQNIVQIKRFLKTHKKYSNMLMDDKREFAWCEPIRLYDYIKGIYRHHHSTLFRMSDKPSDMCIYVEIFYSRFVVLQEMHEARITKMETLPEFTNRTGNRENSVHQLYRAIIHYHLMSSFFSSQTDLEKERHQLVAMAKRTEFRVSNSDTEEEATDVRMALPRFFSHPNIKVLLTQNPRKKVDHYVDRHKIFTLIQHAAHHMEGLEWLQPKVVEVGGKYLQPILRGNKGSTIPNHMAMYLEFCMGEEDDVHHED